MIFFGTSNTMVQLTITASLFGMACGQLFVGPITDAFGRRSVLLIALATFVLTSLACVLAPNITWMIIARFVLGFVAAAGFVTVNAFIRDMATGNNAARLYATQATISSMAPVLAPLVGGQLLLLGDWHVVFIFLVFLGAAVMGLVWLYLPETLAVSNRSKLSFASTFKSWGSVLGDPRFVMLTCLSGFMFGAIATFIAGAPFALEQGFHLTPTQYTSAFASGTIVLFTANFINRHQLKRRASIHLIRFGLSMAVLACIVFTGLNLMHVHNLVVSMLSFGLVFLAIGFINPNVMGLAMQEHAERAGVAAGLIGFASSLFGAIAAPLTSVFFGLDIVGVTTFMTILLAGAALLGFIGLRREQPVVH